MRASLISPAVLLVCLLQACTPASGRHPRTAPADPQDLRRVAYQLQGYEGGRLDAIAATDADVAVIDMARDGDDYFTADEVRMLRESGKRVLAYFEIGSIEDFRPDYEVLRREHPDLLLNEWPDWPGEYFARYWTDTWWQRVIVPRLDRAIEAGFDGVYLDTPLAYEELDLKLVRGESRASLARRMSDLIVAISRYAKERRPGFWVFPQNSPELYKQPGYLDAIDGIGMEDLFFQAMDVPCDEPWCAQNLAATRKIRDAGKVVIAVDYAVRPDNVAEACRRHREERFAGVVTVRDLDTPHTQCPASGPARTGDQTS